MTAQEYPLPRTLDTSALRARLDRRIAALDAEAAASAVPGGAAAPWEVGDSVSKPLTGTTPTDDKTAGQPGKKGLSARVRKIDAEKQARRREQRAARMALRAVAAPMTADANVSKCGRFMVAKSVDLHLRAGQSYMTGLMTCKKIWLDPVCSAAIRHARVLDIETAVDRHLASGGGVEFLTVTLRHWKQHSLALTYGTVKEGWRRMFQGAAGQRLVSDFGIFGRIRADEVTFGGGAAGNGWHPHLHVLIFTDKPWTVTQRAAFVDRLWEVWGVCAPRCASHRAAACNCSRPARSRKPHAPRCASRRPGECSCWRNGLPTPIKDRALVCKSVPSSKSKVFSTYLVKAQGSEGKHLKSRSVGMEMGRGDLERAIDEGNYTPFQMLEWLLDHQTVGACDACKDVPASMRRCARVRMFHRAWGEYERATHRRRCIEWSKGLHEHFFGTPDPEDEDLCEEDAEEDELDLIIASWDFHTWCAIRRGGPGTVARLYDLAETDGPDAVAAEVFLLLLRFGGQ